MLAGKGGCGQNGIARIGVHIILLRVNLEVAQAARDLVVGVRDLHGVIDDVSRMRDPLSADHPLIARVLAKGIARAAVPSGQTDA